MNKKQARRRRAMSTRAKIRECKMVRLTIYRTPRHMYAQIVSPDGKNTLVSAATVEKTFKDKKTGSIEAAAEIGKMIAERAIKIGIKQVAFDRSGFKYHGRIEALADNAREAGLEF